MKKEQEIIHRKKSISSPAPERIYRMLSKQDKINIYGLLQQEFTSEEKTPLAKVALYLSGKGLHYQEFGYSKLKSLLSDCHEFLTLSESQEKGHVDYVTLHSWKSHDVFVADKKKEMPAKDKKQSPSQGKEIPLSDQKKIYSSLKESFETKGEYPMALIAQKVNDSGFNHHEYGYGKMNHAAFPFHAGSNPERRTAEHGLYPSFPQGNGKEDYPESGKQKACSLFGKAFFSCS